MISYFCEENNRLKMSINNGKTWVDLGPAEDGCLEEAESFNPCDYCSLASECCCQNGIVCMGPDGPIYAPCVDDVNVQNNILKTYQAIMNKWERKWKYEYKTKEEKEMNKVLELYVEREKNKIRKEYRELRENAVNEDIKIKEFNNIVNTFKEDLNNLVDTTIIENPQGQVFVKTGYELDLPVAISHEYKDSITRPLYKEEEEAISKINDFNEEVNALLSISDDKDYQIEVLTKYDILNKKGMMN